jgi:hypothetical protein
VVCVRATTTAHTYSCVGRSLGRYLYGVVDQFRKAAQTLRERTDYSLHSAHNSPILNPFRSWVMVQIGTQLPPRAAWISRIRQAREAATLCPFRSWSLVFSQQHAHLTAVSMIMRALKVPRPRPQTPPSSCGASWRIHLGRLQWQEARFSSASARRRLRHPPPERARI